MARQFGTNTVRVSWTPPLYHPFRGYLITTGDTRPTDFSAGIRFATTTLFSRDVGQVSDTTVKYWLVALYRTLEPIILGPVSVTVRGKEVVTHIDKI